MMILYLLALAFTMVSADTNTTRVCPKSINATKLDALWTIQAGKDANGLIGYNVFVALMEKMKNSTYKKENLTSDELETLSDVFSENKTRGEGYNISIWLEYTEPGHMTNGNVSYCSMMTYFENMDKEDEPVDVKLNIVKLN